MKKQLLNLGKGLNKIEQKMISGGGMFHNGTLVCENPDPFGNCGSECLAAGGIWYGCVSLCVEANSQHFAPC